MTDAKFDPHAEVTRRLTERAQEFLSDLSLAFETIVLPEASAAERVMLAHLMTASSGYGYVDVIASWSYIPKDGFQTYVAYLPDVGDGTCPTFAFRCQFEAHHRDLAVIIHDGRKGPQSAVQIMLEQDLRSLDFEMISFGSDEVLANPRRCRDHVEAILSRMNKDLLDNFDTTDTPTASTPSGAE